MFKSEIANRIISLVGFLLIVSIAVFQAVGDPMSPIYWVIVVVFIAFHLYGIINYYLKKNRDDSFK